MAFRLGRHAPARSVSCRRLGYVATSGESNRYIALVVSPRVDSSVCPQAPSKSRNVRVSAGRRLDRPPGRAKQAAPAPRSMISRITRPMLANEDAAVPMSPDPAGRRNPASRAEQVAANRALLWASAWALCVAFQPEWLPKDCCSVQLPKWVIATASLAYCLGFGLSRLGHVRLEAALASMLAAAHFTILFTFPPCALCALVFALNVLLAIRALGVLVRDGMRRLPYAGLGIASGFLAAVLAMPMISETSTGIPSAQGSPIGDREEILVFTLPGCPGCDHVMSKLPGFARTVPRGIALRVIDVSTRQGHALAISDGIHRYPTAVLKGRGQRFTESGMGALEALARYLRNRS